MGYVKASKAELGGTITTKITELKTLCETIVTNGSGFASDAKTYSATWATKFLDNYKTTIKNGPKQSDLGSWSYYTSDGASCGEYSTDRDPSKDHWHWDEDKVADEARRRIASKKTAFDALADNTASLTENGGEADTVATKIQEIVDAIDAFESWCAENPDAIDLKKALGDLGENFSVEDMTMNIDGEQVDVQTLVYTDADGNKYTIAERVNAFYTYVGITMASDIALAYANSELSGADLEALLSDNVKNMEAAVNAYATKHFFSVASQAGIAGMYEDAFGETYDADAVHSKYMDYLKDFDVDGFADSLAGLTNAGRIGAMALAGLVAGAYNPGDGNEDPKKEEDPTPDPTNENPTGTIPTGTTPTGYNPTGYNPTGQNPTGENPTSTPTETPTSTPTDTPTATPEITTITEGDIPEKIEPIATTEEDIDELAREAFDDQFAEEGSYEEYQTELINKFDELYDTEGQDALRGKLEEYGYDSNEIEFILADRDLARNAFLAGEQSLVLTQLANQIAKDHGIENFDTGYDLEGENVFSVGYDYLNNGDVNAFLTNVNADPTVSAAKADYVASRTAYDEAVTTANESIDAVNTAKAELDEYTKTLDSDHSKWTSEQVEKYNEYVKKYNESYEKCKTDKEAADKAKEDYDAKQEAYSKAKKEYLDSIKEKYANGNGDESDNPEGTEGLDAPESVSDGSSDEELIETLNLTDTSASIK